MVGSYFLLALGKNLTFDKLVSGGACQSVFSHVSVLWLVPQPEQRTPPVKLGSDKSEVIRGIFGRVRDGKMTTVFWHRINIWRHLENETHGGVDIDIETGGSALHSCGWLNWTFLFN